MPLTRITLREGMSDARLQQLSDELREARLGLAERRRIEQAKQLLMQRHQLSEQAAYERLRRTAMDHGARLIDVAEQLLARG